MVIRVLVCLAALASVALADNADLARAKAAVAAIKYDEAKPLLANALRAGGLSRAELVELYQLAASTAIVLGDPDAGEQHYRHWLALEPDAQLSDSVAPKLREPFVAAQRFMAKRGKLAVVAHRRGDALEIVVEADPIAMVATIVVAGTPHTPGPDRMIHVGAVTADQIAVQDEFGNELVETVAITEVAAPPREPEHRVATVAFVRRPIVWAIPAAAVLISGVIFGSAANSANDDVQSIAANPAQHFPDELRTARERRDRFALLANTSFVVGGACAITAVVMYVTRSPTFVTPVQQGAVVSMSTRW